MDRGVYVVLIVVFGLLGFGLVWIAVGCGWGKGACAVVDIADYACDVTPIRYLGPDGKPTTEEVPTKEVEALAKHRRLMRLAAERADGGTDR